MGKNGKIFASQGAKSGLSQFWSDPLAILGLIDLRSTKNEGHIRPNGDLRRLLRVQIIYFKLLFWRRGGSWCKGSKKGNLRHGATNLAGQRRWSCSRCFWQNDLPPKKMGKSNWGLLKRYVLAHRLDGSSGPQMCLHGHIWGPENFRPKGRKFRDIFLVKWPRVQALISGSGWTVILRSAKNPWCLVDFVLFKGANWGLFSSLFVP